MNRVKESQRHSSKRESLKNKQRAQWQEAATFPQAERLFVVESMQDIESTIGVSVGTLQETGKWSGGKQKQEYNAENVRRLRKYQLPHQLPTKFFCAYTKKIEEDTELSPTEILFVKRVHAKPFKKLRLLKRPQLKLHLWKLLPVSVMEAISKFNELLGRWTTSINFYFPIKLRGSTTLLRLVIEKSRRIGMTYVQALEDMMDTVTNKEIPAVWFPSPQTGNETDPPR